MKKALLLALTLSLSAPAFASKVKETKPTAAPENPFTEERNAAIAGLSTTLVMMQKMERGCGSAENKFTLNNQVKKWQEKNKPYLVMHSNYIQGLVGSLKNAEGEEESNKLLNSLKKLSNDEANTAIKKILETEGKQNACSKYFNLISNGKMDIKEGFPNYKTLKEMLEFSNKKTNKQKK